MAGGGQPERGGISWGAVNTAFSILVVIVGALMGYAYINGGTSTRIERIEVDLRDKATKQDAITLRQYIDQIAHDEDRRLDRLERRR